MCYCYKSSYSQFEMKSVTLCSHVYIWQDKKTLEQASLQNEQTCIAFSEMLCATAEGRNSDNLCYIFNGMLENAISPLIIKKQHKSNCWNNIKITFLPTLGMTKNVNL